MSEECDSDAAKSVEKLKKKFEVARTRSVDSIFHPDCSASTATKAFLSPVLGSQKDHVSSKGNIRRTPAFRCDKLIRARNVVAHSNSIRGRPHMVADRVKLFEDSKSERKKILKSAKSNSCEDNSAGLVKKKVTTSLSLNNAKTHLNILSVTPNKKSKESQSKNTEKINIDSKSKHVEEFPGAPIFDVQVPSGVELTENLRLALMSPLPAGPPPKKPPRTFTHKFSNVELNNSNNDNSCCEDNEPKCAPSSKHEKAKSKHESQIMLKKLENVLANHQTPTGKIVVKPKNFSSRFKNMIDKSIGPNEGEHTGYGFKSPHPPLSFPERLPLSNTYSEYVRNDSFLGSCLESFGCASSRNILRPFPFFKTSASKLNEFCDICPESKVDVNFSKTDNHFYGTLHKCKSEEHLYAEPNVLNKNVRDMCHKEPLKVCGSVENLVSFQPQLKPEKRLNHEDLHYMCTPLSQNVPYEVSQRWNVQSGLESCTNVYQVKSLAPPDEVLDDEGGLEPHLFTAIILIEINLHKKSPTVKYKFPITANVPYNIGDICFPHLQVTSSGSFPKDFLGIAADGNLSLINTEALRENYAYCRIVSNSRRTPGSSRYAVCILSPVRNCHIYFQILNQIDEIPVADVINSFSDLYNSPFPRLGESLPFKIIEGRHGVISRPTDLWKEVYDFYDIISKLGVPILLFLFVSVLYERNILLFSHSVSFLASCVWMLTEMITPFTWQHTLVSVVPFGPQLDKIIHSQKPYICGVLKLHKGMIPPITIKKGMIVDIDTLNILQAVGDEMDILPKLLQEQLERNIQNAITISFRDRRLCNILILKSLLKIFSEFFKNVVVFTKECDTNGNERFGDKEIGFLKDAFLASMKVKGYNVFLEKFIEMDMFLDFIKSFKQGKRKGTFKYFRTFLQES